MDFCVTNSQKHMRINIMSSNKKFHLDNSREQLIFEIFLIPWALQYKFIPDNEYGSVQPLYHPSLVRRWN